MPDFLQIGGISFQLSSRPAADWLQAPPYPAFRFLTAEPGAVTFRLRRLDRRSLRTPLPPRGGWPAGIQLETETVSGQLLRVGWLRRWVEQALARPCPPRIILHERWLAGLDFEERSADFFYLKGRPVEILPGSGERATLYTHYLKPGLPPLPPLPELPPLHPVFASGGPAALPLLCAPQVQAWLLACHSDWPALEIWGTTDSLRVLNRGAGRLDVFYYPDGSLTDLVAMGVIRRLTAAFFPLFDRLQIHASGVVRRGSGGSAAALFLAHSGGGKTTAARLNGSGTLLSDDQVVVERRAGRFWGLATPFARLPVSADQAPVGALILLEKARTFELRRCAPSEVAFHLHAEQSHYTRWLPPALKKQVFETTCDLAYQVPTYRMSFPKDFIDWSAVDAALGVN